MGTQRGQIVGPRRAGRLQRPTMWLPIHTAPFHAQIELAMIDSDGLRALIFPCGLGTAGMAKAPMLGASFDARGRVGVE